MVAKAGAERQAPVLDLAACVEAIKNLAVKRELVDIEAEVAALASKDPGASRLTELVLKKIALRRRLGDT